ncbi:hypothetical protein FAM09_18230 [Niastella caeni]|uniref:Uncharacterized protein n=1 Tax=Niastella caeni TaxID=2569763 RepID=A0A4S8HPZ8_9BACT|nr:hypothetical protein [Niastella caeni]THU36901.1 hypothetical protein FAM09_18230 [Niastella caeni]
MANHCIEVGCAHCGAWYCIRGCESQPVPGKNSTLLIKEKIKTENAVRYENATCIHCKTNNLYWL